MKKTNQILYSLFLLVLYYNNTIAQFAPAAGEVGTTAIPKDSSIIIAWAANCTVVRGLMDISQPSLGYVNSGIETHATGAAGDGMALSLGDSGVATLTFEYPIYDGSGADFVIFENSFSNTFLELAFVEVSSDGQQFVRFPAISNTDTSVQVNSFGAVDPTKIHNLAGKYRANYGTPFDLADLIADSVVLNIQQITHVRLVDAIGCMQDLYASRDSRGVKVNDPWATPFPSSGFDLDAVGVIHSNTNIAVHYLENKNLTIYPNPVAKGQAVIIKTENLVQQYNVYLYSLLGEQLGYWENATEIPTSTLGTGVYVLLLQGENGEFLHKKFVVNE